MEAKTTKTDESAAASLHAVLTQAEEEHWLERPNASLMLRGASFLLDLILIYLVTHSTEKLLGALSFYVSESQNFSRFSSLPLLIGFIDVSFRFSFLFFYLIICVSDWGGTLGKLLLGLRVVDSQSGKCLPVSRAAFRLLLCVFTNLLSLSVGMARRDRVMLHDLLAGSTVKRVRGKI